MKDSVAPWQHVSTYGLSIGARGTINYPNGINAITSGTANWPPATGAGGPEAIDDMWHAAVNSRGKYFNASNAQQLAESIVSALADFTDQSGTGTAVGIGGAQLSVTNQYAYKTSYEAGIWGDVKKYAIDLNTGVLPVDANGNPANAPLWSAATQLDAQAAVSGAGQRLGHATPHRDDQRRDATPRFRSASPTSPPRSSPRSPPAGASRRTPPTRAIGAQFPARRQVERRHQHDELPHALAHARRYRLFGARSRSARRAAPMPTPERRARRIPATTRSRPRRRRARRWSTSAATTECCTRSSTTRANGGKEAWAYIPKVLFSGGDPNDTRTHAVASFQIGALAFRRGGIPLYSHKFYVNATPRVWDIDFANTNTVDAAATGNDWRTMLVGGLGAGGRSVYALDVTNPIAPPPPFVSADTEATAASKVLWEFTDANLGYVYDAPTLVKTYAYGWVVLVASGYNNPGGKGFLYVLNPNAPTRAGQLLKKIPLPSDTGTDTDPTDLSTIRAFTASRQNPYVLQAYGGDIKGNVWRFDLSNPDASQWRAEKIATLKDATNKPQPITTGVRIEIDQNNNVDRYLFVGTGKLLDQQDLVDTSVINSFYVIRDGTWTAPEPAPAVPYSRANLTAVTGTSVAGIGSVADRPRLVPGRHRRQPQDQLGRLRRRQRRRVRLLEAVDGPVPRRRCRRRCMPAISRPAIRCSSASSGTHRRERRHRGRHRGRRADSGGLRRRARRRRPCSCR